MKKAINDATLQKTGDVYQYFLALLECFSLKSGETMTIETYGDVSRISPNTQRSLQKEIKHHINKQNLSDRNEDFWNTLENWCTESSIMASFDKLVFCTTATVQKKSIFYEWNEKTPTEKYEILRECGEIVKSKEKSFRVHYSQIFCSDSLKRKEIEDVLGKVEIWPDQLVISRLDVLFFEAARHIPTTNKRLYIDYLLGRIISKVADPPHKWIVKAEEFNQMVIDATARFSKSDTVNLRRYSTDGEPSAQQLEFLSDKVFVKEIERIEYSDVISEAITDYWRTHTQVISKAQNDMLFMESLPSYRTDLLRRLTSEKRRSKRAISGKPVNDQVLASQDMYDRATGWEASNFGYVIGNEGYFQNGIIHEIVDEKEFTWHLGDNDEH